MRILAALIATSCLVAVPLGASPTVEGTRPTKGAQAQRDTTVSRTEAFLQRLDHDRIGERAYAKRILLEMDALLAGDLPDGDLRTAMEVVRLVALWAADRPAEAIVFAETIFTRGAAAPQIYAIAFQFAAYSDPVKALAFLDQADMNLTTPQQRAAFRDEVEESIVSEVTRTLAKAKDQAGRARLAEGLLKFDWPGDGQFGRQDYQRVIALRGRVAKGDVGGARALAGQIATPRVALELLIDKSYDPLVDHQDRVARFAALVAAEDQRSLRALDARPDDLKLILERAQFLRSIGRDSDALALLRARTGDMAKVEKGGADAFWLVNEQAYALSALGRPDEAIALMRRLLALGIDKHPDLISMAINLGGIMNRAGLHREAAAYSEKLFRDDARKASEYGHMWMWQVAACGHASSGNMAAAKPWIERLRADPDANRAALMLGLLCTNDLDGAASQLIERLDGDEASDMLMAVQDYTIALNSAHSRTLDSRLQQIVARPAVATAIASKGRILKLPLSRTYWGMY